ncbi:MAG: hypothetical protein GX556_10450 [Fibrobacter sp.]|nr:hypothetical protein [Fibrobacter sp.]
MKKALLCLACALVFSQSALAQSKIPRFEAGILLGEPLGLSVKLWYNQFSAADASVAWSFTENGVFEVHADYILHFLKFDFENGVLPIYIGLGPALRIGNEWFIGGRLPVGLSYIFDRLPISLFGEIAPQWQLLPGNKFVLSGGAGIRIALGSAD